MRKRWVIGAVSFVPLAVAWAVWQFAFDGADPRAILWPAQGEPAPPAMLHKIVSLHVDDQPLRDVLAELGEEHALAIEIDDGALQAIGVSSGAKVTLHADGLTLRSLLELLVREVDGRLVAVDRGGGILTTTADRWRTTLSNCSTRVYRLDALLAQSADGISEAALAQIVQAVVTPDNWSSGFGGGNGQIETAPGVLIVQQLPEAQRRIEALLAGLVKMQSENGLREPLLVDVPETAVAGRKRVLEALDTPCSIDVAGARLDDTIASLAQHHGVPILIDTGALESEGVGGDTLVTLTARNVSLRSLLHSLLRSEWLTFVVWDGAIVVTSYEAAEQAADTRLYPVADLAGGQFSPEALVDIVTSGVAPDTWVDVGGPAGAGCVDGVLIVRQTDENHDAVVRLLAELRHVLRPSLFPPPKGPVDVAARRIKAVLEGPTAFDFQTVSLEELADFVSRKHQLNVTLDTRSLNGVGIGGDMPVSFVPQSMPLKTALRLLLRQFDLTYRVLDETLLITTPEEAEAYLLPRYYRVPRVLQARVGDAWVERVTGCVAPDTWEDVGGPGSLCVRGELFVLRQTEEVCDETLAFLNVLEHAVEHCRDSTQPIELDSRAVEFERRVRARLEAPTSIDAVNEPFGRVVQQLARQHDVPIVPDVRALDAVGIGAESPVSLKVEDVPLRTALILLARQLELVVVVDQGVVEITTPEEAEARLYGRLYPVAELVEREPDKSLEALADTLIAATGEDWEKYGGPGSIDELGGVLLVYTTFDAHLQIEEVLAALRKPPSLEDTASYPVGIAPDSANLLASTRLYPIADLQRRFLPVGQIQFPLRRRPIRELWWQWQGVSSNCFGWNGVPSAPEKFARAPDRGWAATFAERLESALRLFGGRRGEQSRGAAVFGDVLCASGSSDYHRTIELVLARLREAAAVDVPDVDPPNVAASGIDLPNNAAHHEFARLYDLRPCLQAFPELDGEQFRELVMRMATPAEWSEPPLPYSSDAEERRTGIVALPSLLLVLADAEEHAAVERCLAFARAQAGEFPRPSDLHRDDNRDAIAALALRLRSTGDPLEAAWLAALAAMIDRPLPSDVRAELSAAVTERMIQARARGETDLALSLCHAIAQLGEPADLAVAELTAALANERNDARREFLVETLVALGATGRSAAVARLTLLAASNDAGAKRDVRSILDSLGRQGPRATDAIPALLEMLAGQHARVASDSLMRIDPGGEASRTFVRSKLSDPNLSQVERRRFKELEQEVEGCFAVPAYNFSLGLSSGLP